MNKTKKNKFFVTSLMYFYSNSGASSWASLELHTQDNLVNYPFEKIWLWRYRTSLRIFRVEVSRNEFLPSPLESFVPLLFEKVLEMIDKSESIYRANVWWILAADDLTFEEIIGSFREKYPVDWFRGEACKDTPGKNNILHWKKKSLMTYIMLKKISHRYMSGKKFVIPN